MKRNLIVVLFVLVLLIACAPTPTSTPLPLTTATALPISTVTETITLVPSPTLPPTATATPLPTKTATPTPKPTLSPDKVGGLPGIPLPSQALIEQGMKTGVIRQKVEVGELTFEVKENLNKPGTKIVFGRDPATKDIVLATRLNASTQEYEWYVAGLRDLADAVGMRVGGELSNPYISLAARTTIDQLVINEFNSAFVAYTSFHQTEIRQGVFDFNKADTAIALAQKNNMYVRGDMPVYGLSNFQWTFLKDLRNLTRNELVEIMKNHILQLLTHFKGRVNLWPVVNEARPLSETNLYNTGPYDNYWAIIGPDYVDIAFESARNADPSAVLIYNETRNEQSKGMYGRLSQSTRDIANRLKSKGLIDGVGIQMHLNGSQPPDVNDLIQTLKSYGLPIYLTEFDVDMSKVPGTLEEKNRIQAQIYKDVFKACLDLGVCRDVYFWGISDKYSGGVGTPQMFDDDLKPKPAYFAIRDVLSGK